MAALSTSRRARTGLARMLALATLLLPVVALAGPVGEQVVRGNVSFSRQGDLTVIRASDNSIINYQNFDIARQETVRFIQPSAAARVLNRIKGAAPTRIDGALLANGHVYIVNPAGVYFGPSAIVDVAGIHAAAGNISNEDFLAGIDRFVGVVGEVVNRGTILGEAVTLVGTRVANYGSIVAERGSVVMAAGEEVLVGRRDGHIFAKVTAPATKGGVENSGSVQAPGGTVLLGVGDTYSLAIQQGAVVQARTIKAQGGKGSTVEVAGTVQADPGGTILIGGDFQGAGDMPHSEVTFIGPQALLSAPDGTVVVWSDRLTVFAGAIEAALAEVSSAGTLVFQGNVAALSGSSTGGGARLLNGALGEKGWIIFSHNRVIDNVASAGTTGANGGRGGGVHVTGPALVSDNLFQNNWGCSAPPQGGYYYGGYGGGLRYGNRGFEIRFGRTDRSFRFAFRV